MIILYLQGPYLALPIPFLLSIYLNGILQLVILTSINQKLLKLLITPRTKILYAESPTNPAIDIIDLELLGKLAKKHNILLVIDNCFATPYLQNPIKYGADLVLHSATKLMDGQGRVLGGVAVGRAELIREIYLFCKKYRSCNVAF